ncbi:MAG: riboflavin synthase [Ilyomonas sp.]
MFTGIIEQTGLIKKIETTGSNKTFWISSQLSNEFKIDQSVSHDGVCLTVEEVKDGMHCVTAIEETLRKSNLDNWQEDDEINLERCMQMNGRIDGHIVQGHVDTTAVCIEKKNRNGSWEYTFEFDEAFASLVIEKGSISVNGTSLTLFNTTRNSFTVAVIPFTHEHTNIKYIEKEKKVNIEFDMIGKYIQRYLQLK